MSTILTERGFYLVYQAQWQNGIIVSYEALLRHISGKDRFPRTIFESFSIAQQQDITILIIEEVQQAISLVSLPIAFNIPARLLSDDIVTRIVQQNKNIPQGFLRCEIVEDEVLDEAHMPSIRALSQAGIELVIDDLIEQYSVDNLSILEAHDLSCIIKVEMRPEFGSMLEQYRSKGYRIIQEGDWVDLSSNDILQSNKLSVPQKLFTFE